MPRTRRFMQLDVFSSRPLLGNPLAVVIDGEGLDDATMQAFARWTNLSETTFLLPPTTGAADYRVRIFTPRQELPFAGHPSVGSAYAAIEAGLVDAAKTSLVQECAAGLLPVRIKGTGASRVIHVQAPPARVEVLDRTVYDHVMGALGADASLHAGSACMVDNGPHWIICDLQTGSAVRSLQPDMAAIAALCTRTGAVGVSVFGQESSAETAMAVRAFCPADGMPEDPVTGSANAAIMAMLAARMLDHPRDQHHFASQGREVGRDGIVEVCFDAASGSITVGGHCVVGIRGDLHCD